ncbi:MAG: N-acetylmuramoyl-L-alanine amidase, partial [Deltaproteobacteria bacterium]|nr:N-acetylmuramoyl-L-alanine amidase [Deltaproteobacteria bacterium]
MMTALVAVLSLSALDAPGQSSRPAPCAEVTRRFALALDPGHDPERPGALSARNRPEVEFNDRLVAAIARQLGGERLIDVQLTRRPGESLALEARAARIASLRPDLVLSIHHDSVQPQLLRPWTTAGQAARHCDDHVGYSLFVPRAAPGAADALHAAQAIGRALLATGYRFTRYHALPIAGEGRAWVDAEAGVYDGDYLFLLRTSRAPIVLLEAGFIINRESEQRLADPVVVEALARAIAAGVCRHAAQREAGSGRPP